MANDETRALREALQATHETVRQKDSPWVSWQAIAARLRVDPDRLAAIFEFPLLKQFVRQNRTGHKVCLTEKGFRAVNKPIDEFEVTFPAPLGPCWIYYSYFALVSKDLTRLLIHYGDCGHCNSGLGHGGEKVQRVDPSVASVRLPNTAWIGPFANASLAADWCKQHPRIHAIPERCAHCFVV